jgi:hypothetical protein
VPVNKTLFTDYRSISIQKNAGKLNQPDSYDVVREILSPL